MKRKTNHEAQLRRFAHRVACLLAAHSIAGGVDLLGARGKDEHRRLTRVAVRYARGPKEGT